MATESVPTTCRYGNRQRRHAACLLPIGAVLLAACGPAPEEKAAPVGAPKLDACAMLRAAQPSVAFGQSMDDGQLLWEAHTATTSSSQCLFSSISSDDSVGLLVRWSPDSSAPASRAVFIERSQGDDLLGGAEEVTEALSAGHEVPGLGDLALSYELFGHNVMIWHGNYQSTVMVSTTTGNGESIAERVARSVVEQY